MVLQLNTRNQGFTLIELAVVMVVIALLAAGISIAENIAAQAKLNSVVEDFQKFQMAYTNFHNRYRAVPGDMTNASSYWPSYLDCATTPSNCNGDGNGFIEYNATTEMHAAWKQLSLAGLVDAAIQVVPNSYNGQAIGVNVYPSKIRYAGYVMFSERISQYVNNDNPFFNGFRPTTQTNAVFLAKPDTQSPVEFDAGAITAIDAFNIDQKMDNGAWDASGNALGSTSGNIRVYGVDVTGGNECTINHTAVDANSYNLSIQACIVGRALN
jgi:prepilin-type N-terminal cleavage/methylation domain-containing protein